MIVYRFLDKDAGLNTVRTRRLRISRIGSLNDPFEFLAADLSDRIFRRAFVKMKRAMSKSRGIICFSKDWQNPVLWGHYADRYRGLCLGFEVRAELTKIDYVNQRIRCVGDDIDEAQMQKILSSKFEHWGYENEYRLFCSLDEKSDDDHYYLDFSDDIKLKRVMVGAESTITRAELANALGEIAHQVKVFKVRPAFRKFKVVKNRNERSWK